MNKQDTVFKDFCQRMVDIHERKAHDYSKEGDRFSNFTRASSIAEWYANPVDKTFATMIGIKFARLAELLNGKVPKNESIDDTFLDCCTYMAIWYTWFAKKSTPSYREMSPAEIKRLYNFKVNLKDLESPYENTSSKASTRSNGKVRTPKSQTRYSRVKGRKSCRGGLQS